jgi:hypothetical protein
VGRKVCEKALYLPGHRADQLAIYSDRQRTENVDAEDRIAVAIIVPNSPPALGAPRRSGPSFTLRGVHPVMFDLLTRRPRNRSRPLVRRKSTDLIAFNLFVAAQLPFTLIYVTDIEHRYRHRG